MSAVRFRSILAWLFLVLALGTGVTACGFRPRGASTGLASQTSSNPLPDSAPASISARV